MRILPIANNNYSIEFGNLRELFQRKKELRQKQAEERNAFEADLIANSDRYVAAHRVGDLQTDLSLLNSHRKKLLAERDALNSRISELDTEICDKGKELACAEADYYSYDPNPADFGDDAKKGAIISHRREAESAAQSVGKYVDWPYFDYLNNPYNNTY